MNRKIILMLILILLINISLIGCNGESNIESAESSNNSDTFKVGLEAGYPPFNWTQIGAVKISGNSEYAGGYDVEIAKKIAEGLGKELEIVKLEWDGLLPALTSNKIDAIIAGMSPTKERMETIDFSNNYYKSDLVMIVKKGSKYEDSTSINDFKGAKVTAQLNTFHYSVIDQIDGVLKDVAMDSFPAMRVALQSGMIDGYVSERPEGVSAIAANDNFAMVNFQEGFNISDDDTAIAVGLKKESDLRAKINEILKGISGKERQDIMDKAIKNQPTSQE